MTASDPEEKAVDRQLEIRRSGTDWRSVAGEMAGGARQAFSRFPITTILLLLAAANAVLLLHQHGLFSDGRNDFVVPLLGAALTATSATLFWESRTGDPWIRHCGSLIAAVFVFCLLWLDTAMHTLDWTLAVALVGLLPVSPFIGRGSPTAFWLFAARMCFAALLALLALLLFAGGISAILASLTYLFGVAVPQLLYEHIWLVCGLFVAPLFGLGQIPRDLAREPDLESQAYAQRGIRALGEFVAVPLLLVYALILHAYALKIAISRDVPAGQIGWLVLAFGTSIVGALVVCRPFMRGERAPTAFFLRVWPFLVIVPLILLAYALTLRIGSYGVTPERYLLALFAVVLAALVVLQWFPARPDDIRPMVLVPVVALLVASFGPQGANAISTRSQASRFLAIVNDPELKKTKNDEALGALRYLSAQDALQRVAPKGFVAGPDAVDAGEYRAVARAWGLNPDRNLRNADRFFSLTYPQQEAVAVSRFDLVVPDAGLIVGQRKPVTVSLPDRSGELQVSLDKGSLTIAGANWHVAFAIDPERVTAIIENGTGSMPKIVLESQGRRVMLAPSFLYGEKEPQPQIRNFAGAIFLRAGDWE